MEKSINNNPESKMNGTIVHRATIRDILSQCSHHLDKNWIDIDEITEAINGMLGEDVTLNQLYYFIADYCAGKISYHIDYNKLASRVCVQRLHKATDENYKNIVEKLYNNLDVQGNPSPLISREFYDLVINNADRIQNVLDFEKDYQLDYFGLKTLERSYLLRINIKSDKEKDKGKKQMKTKILERPQHLFMRTALFIHGSNLEKAFETYRNMSDRYFTHATPTLFNAGSTKPQGSSCFLLTMNDSLDGIFKIIDKCAKISKAAGGIGVDISRIRANKSYIRGTNGFSNGIIPLCCVLNTVAKYVNQGGKRNGSIACFLETWHADIYEFCDLRKNTGNEETKARDLFIALWISDLFMKRVESDGLWSLMCPDECPNLTETYGEEFEKLYEQYEREGRYKRQVYARDLWFHILEAQIETGTPYMLFKDNINKKSNQSNIGIIRSSNLCVHGSTMILTTTGYHEIKSLVDQWVTIWNGSEWSLVNIKRTGKHKNLVRVSLSNGAYLDCTPEHKFYVQKGFARGKQIEIAANNLQIDDNLIKFDLPNARDFEPTEIFMHPYTHGIFCGDGTTYDNYSKTLKYAKIDLYGEKKELLEHIDYTHCSYYDEADKCTLVLPKNLRPKFDIPMYSDIATKLRWFEGYCDADGTIARNGTNEALQITSIEKEFLIKVRYMLHTLGIESKITLNKDARIELLPDGCGGQKEYECKQLWRLLVSSSALYKLAMIGFKPHRLKFTIRKPNRNAEQFVHVTSIEKSYQDVDTYCFMEPIRHMGVFNGILTGQCAEIVEVTSDDEVAVCNLASICLPRFCEVNPTTNKLEFNFKKLVEISKIATYNLNNLIDKNYYPVEQAKTSNLRHRPIGIGVQGLADVYNQMGFPFGSDESNKLNKQIFETIYFGALTASNEIARKTGKPYETFEGSPFSKGQLQFHLWGISEDSFSMGYDWEELIENIKTFGTSNSLLTALMPTASTSQIMGNCESFEPYLSNIFTRSTLAGDFIVVNQNLVKDLIKRNLWSKDMRNQIVINNGSVQSIDNIPGDLKEIYKTAFEIKQKHIVRQAIDRGCFIDQTQSMNLFIDKPDYVKLESAHFDGWKNGLKTGMYYLRSQPAINPIKFGIDVDLINKFTKVQSNIGADIDDDSELTKEIEQPQIEYRTKKDRQDKPLEKGKSKERGYVACEMCSS